MDPAILPDLVPPAGLLGEITPQAAAATGIPAGLPLIAAAADKACEVIGAGALEPNIACLSYGTTATHQHHPPPLYRSRSRSSRPTRRRCRALTAWKSQIYRGFWMVTWFKQEFGEHEEDAGRRAGGRTRRVVRRAGARLSRRAREGWCCSPTGRPG